MHTSTLTSPSSLSPAATAGLPVVVTDQSPARTRIVALAVACAAVGAVAASAAVAVSQRDGSSQVRVPSSTSLSAASVDRAESAHGAGADVRSLLGTTVAVRDDDPLARMHGGAGTVRSTAPLAAAATSGVVAASQSLVAPTGKLALLLG